MFMRHDELAALQNEDSASPDNSEQPNVKNTLLIYVRQVPPVDQKSEFLECQAEVLVGTDNDLDKVLVPGSKVNACELGLPTNLLNDRFPECRAFEVSCLEHTRLAPTSSISAAELLGRIRR